jgi:phosphoribosyl 1,2-cyclic phosphate phosphodiesterase
VKVTFLGTGTSQGIPVITCDCEVCSSLDFRDQRLRTSILVETDNRCLVIDTGPDFRQQMLRERVSRLDAVLFTHEHKDHTAGLDDVRAYNFAQGIDMPIYGRAAVIDQLKREFSYIFEEVKYPGVPQVEVHEITQEPFEVAGVPVIPIEVLHYKLPVLGFRIHDFTYITDANFIPEESMAKIRGTKVLVLNALQQKKHISHFNLEEAIEVAREVGAERTYFTHISHRLGIHAATEAMVPEGMQLAWDGLQISL